MDNELIVNEKERKKEKRKLYRDIVFIILFGLLIIWFTGSFLANRNNIENDDNGIKSELVSRSNKTMKQSNRKNVDTINYKLDSYNDLTNVLELSFDVCNSFLVENSNYYYLFNRLALTYDLNTNSFTYNEFEIELSDDNGEVYYLTYYQSVDLINFLNSLNSYNFANIETSVSDDEVILYFLGTSNNVSYSFNERFRFENTSSHLISYFGSYFTIYNIVNEVNAIKSLINFKIEEGKSIGENIGYNNGYNNGYDEGYDVGYQEGNSSGYNNGYSAGQTVGYNNGYQVGYDEGLVSNEGYEQGYDEGYDIGHNRGYDQGLSVGLNQGYDNGFIDGQKDTVNEKGFKTLFNAIMNAPYNIFKGILNFEFLGVNLFSLFSFIFTTMLILWIVKIFKK